ncbi:MAG: NAD kinase [Tannerella sp.]|jgi:NAD+ kinase|nr:NAD kinase [Tannerella sp.]
MKIGVFGRNDQTDKLKLIQNLFGKLNERGAEVFVQKNFYTFLTDVLKYHPSIAGVIEGELTGLDIALSVGGDGTFLRTVAQLNQHPVPILGINTGRLGFLADIGSEQLEETLDELFLHNYRIEERMMLQLHSHKHLFQGYNYALNEVAILRRDTSSMITIHTFLNDQYLTSYQADGLIIATPTGSTAYSLSLNGPIIHPESDNIVLSPVAPHSLNVRPLVVPGSYTITLQVENRTPTFLVALDSRSEVLTTETQLKVSKAGFKTSVVHRLDHTFYQTLHDKLMWGVDKRVK